MLIKCPECKSSKTKMVIKSAKFYKFQCIDCGHEFSISYGEVNKSKSKKGEL